MNVQILNKLTSKTEIFEVLCIIQKFNRIVFWNFLVNIFKTDRFQRKSKISEIYGQQPITLRIICHNTSLSVTCIFPKTHIHFTQWTSLKTCHFNKNYGLEKCKKYVNFLLRDHFQLSKELGTFCKIFKIFLCRPTITSKYLWM